MAEEGIMTYRFYENGLYSAQYCQRHILDDGILDEDASTCQSYLENEPVSLPFFAEYNATPSNVAEAAVALSSKSGELENMLQNGEDFLERQWRYCRDNGYSGLEVKFPYIKYFDVTTDVGDMTFCTGDGTIVAINDGNGWQY